MSPLRFLQTRNSAVVTGCRLDSAFGPGGASSYVGCEAIPHAVANVGNLVANGAAEFIPRRRRKQNTGSHSHSNTGGKQNDIPQGVIFSVDRVMAPVGEVGNSVRHLV